MKVLLTGQLSQMHWIVADRLLRDGHQVTLIGNGITRRDTKELATLHSMPLRDPGLHEQILSGRFHAIVYFYAGASVEIAGFELDGMDDALVRIQRDAQASGVSYFFLVTDSRVFAQEQEAQETTVPIPDTPEGVFMKAAEDNTHYCRDSGMQTLVVRATNLYSEVPGDINFFSIAARRAAEDQPMILCGSAKGQCDFLHIDDLAIFLSLSLETPFTGVVHLAYGPGIPMDAVVQQVQTFLPDLTVSYQMNAPDHPVLEGMRAAKAVDWVPRRDWQPALETLLRTPTAPRKESRLQRMRSRVGAVNKANLMSWIEMIGLALVAYFLTGIADRYALVGFIDFWLLYVVLIGSINGALFGALAGVIACVFFGIDWVVAGKDAYLLLVTMDNWLPMLLYILMGGIVGYMRDTSREKLSLLETELEQQRGETDFVENTYRQVLEDRNRLQEQIMRSRDNYGRVYGMIKELDTLQPMQVFLSTLEILESAMENRSVAIYTFSPDLTHARLMVHSRALSGRLARSIRMQDVPKIMDAAERGRMFINSKMEHNYPGYAMPILQENVPMAMVVLWHVPFDQRTLYHQNQLSLIISLVQTSLTRAILHNDTHAADVYIKGTEIYTDEAFRSTVGLYQKMRQKQASNYLLLRMTADDDASSPQEIGARLRRAMRSTDVCGRLSDGSYYLLLPQAEIDVLPLIETRFQRVGLYLTTATLEEE